MKRAMLLISLFFLSCAHQIDVPDINKSESVAVKDLRPASEKESKTFALFRYSAAHSIYRMGDDILIPSPPRLLQHRVFEKFGSTTQPVELTIHHMVIYLNGQAASKRNEWAGAVGGIVGASIARAVTTSTSANPVSTLVDREMFESLAQNEYVRARHTIQENPNDATVYIVYLDAEINGKRVFVRTLTPVNTEDEQNPRAFAVKFAIRYYLTQY